MKLVENGTDSDDEEYEEPPSAYTSLLHTLQATSQSFAKVYAQRYLLPPFRYQTPLYSPPLLKIVKHHWF